VRPAIDPRIRERRIEVIREAGRRRLRVTLVVASAIVVLGLVYLSLRSPLLDVDHIRVAGAQREPASEIVRAAGVRKGDPLVFVNTGAVARRIERLQWVASAHVKRDLPGTLTYSVTEYVPTAFVRVSPSTVALVASTGRVIGFSHGVPRKAFEVIGEHAIPRLGLPLSNPDVAGVVGRLPARLGARVTAIDVGGPSVTLELRTPAGRPPEQLRLGTLDNLGDKGAAALAVLDHLAGQTCAYVDVAAPQAPVSRCT
jgi:cell division protein FtsQ